MYIVPVEVKKSSIEGRGVFSLGHIPKDTIVWKYIEGHDKMMTLQELEQLEEKEKKELENTGYLSPSSNKWVFPPKNDPACYTNHSRNNNLSAVFNLGTSSEPYFIANKDIKVGEELTNNYSEFDKVTQKIKPNWA